MLSWRNAVFVYLVYNWQSMYGGSSNMTEKFGKKKNKEENMQATRRWKNRSKNWP